MFNKIKNNKSKKIFNCTLRVVILIALLGLMIFSVIYAHLGNDMSKKANILTAISGCISGFATILVGVIAYLQSKKYSSMTLQSNMLNMISAYASDIQNSFVNYIKVEKIIDLFYKKKSIYKKENTEKIEYEINDEQIIIFCNFLSFEAVLMKANFASNKIIKLHKTIKDMEESFIFKDTRDFIDDSNYILEWGNKINILVNEIILEYHSLQLQINNYDNLQKIQDVILYESSKITNYFKNISQQQINELEKDN